MIEYDMEIKKLNQKFYNDYPENQYPEILRNTNRCYNCIVLQTNYEYFICVPFRTNIKHSNCYHFSHSNRSILHQSGLDYSKMIIIKDTGYFQDSIGIIDSDEYREMLQNINVIISEIYDYINTYIEYKKNNISIHHRDFLRKYQYSTLKYFEDIISNHDLSNHDLSNHDLVIIYT